MPRWMRDTTDFLHGTGTFAPTAPAVRIPALVALIAAAGPVYGLAMGAYSLSAPDRLWMMVYAAAKVPLLLAVASLLTLLPWMVLNTLLGLRDDLALALRAVLSAQAALSIALASLAPLTLMWYGTVRSYRAALVFNGIMFALATFAGHQVARRYYRVLIAREPRHAIGLLSWSLLYAFVGIQAAWMLRPFVGSPDDPPAFFRGTAFTNAYVEITAILAGLFK